MTSDTFTPGDKEFSKTFLDRECDNLTQEIDRLVNDLQMQEKRLRNVMNLVRGLSPRWCWICTYLSCDPQVFSSVNISDSKLMREMTGAAMKDSAAVCFRYHWGTTCVYNLSNTDEANCLSHNGLPSCILCCRKYASRYISLPKCLQSVSFRACSE